MNSQTTPHAFSCRLSGPFDLVNQSRYFGGWPTLPDEPGAIVMAFPVEGSDRSVAVVIRQPMEEKIVGEVHRQPMEEQIVGEVHGSSSEIVDAARRQALAAISLDADGSGWAAVGSRDPVIGGLQAKYRHLRPTLFHSPYEAGAAFVIGHRISIKQTRALRARIAAEHGTTITIDTHRFHAFPTPAQLLSAAELPGINQTKTERLRAIARAAQEGWLRRETLRAMPQEDALAKLQTLPGIGPFFAQGVLYRGAGTVDTLTQDRMVAHAVAHAYGLKTAPDQQTLEQIAAAWRPYRMWAVVLLNVWARSELGLPQRDARRRSANQPRSQAAQA